MCGETSLNNGGANLNYTCLWMLKYQHFHHRVNQPLVDIANTYMLELSTYNVSSRIIPTKKECVRFG